MKDRKLRCLGNRGWGIPAVKGSRETFWGKRRFKASGFGLTVRAAGSHLKGWAWREKGRRKT